MVRKDIVTRSKGGNITMTTTSKFNALKRKDQKVIWMQIQTLIIKKEKSEFKENIKINLKPIKTN